MRQTLPLIALARLTLAFTAPAWAQDDTAADAAVADEEVEVVVEEEEAVHSFSATMTGVSDYVFRGISQTQEDPTFQASVDYAHISGFYAGIWGSGVDFTPEDTLPEDEDDADVEIDYYVGFGSDFNDTFGYDVSFVYYTYPGTADGVDYDYPELIGKLTGWGWLTFTLGYSWDEFNSGETGIYYNLGGEWALPAEFTANAGIGYFDLDDVLGDSYVDWTVGVSRSIGFVDLSFGYFDTNNDGEALYGPLADDRWVLTASITID